MSRNSASDFLSRSAEAGVKPRIEACAAGTWVVGLGGWGCGVTVRTGRNGAEIKSDDANADALLRSEQPLIRSPKLVPMRFFYSTPATCGDGVLVRTPRHRM